MIVGFAFVLLLLLLAMVVVVVVVVVVVSIITALGGERVAAQNVFLVSSLIAFADIELFRSEAATDVFSSDSVGPAWLCSHLSTGPLKTRPLESL